MSFVVIFVLGCVFLEFSHGYVVLQVRDDNNQSNVEELLHKMISAEKFDKMVINTKIRKQNDEEDKLLEDDVREHIIQEYYEDEKNEKQAINLIDSYVNHFKDFIGSQPLYRSRDDAGKQLFHFRSSNGKPSVKIELNSESIMNALKNALKSPTIKKYAKEVAKNAAVFYRALREQIKNE